MKLFYVNVIRMSRILIKNTGLLKHLDKAAKSSRIALWMRSLFSIYDLEDLVYLDIPWWTFDAKDIVEEALKARDDAIVYEWGSGASTSWLSKRSEKVIAVEHDESWATKVSELKLHNVNLQFVPATPVSTSSFNVESNKKGNKDLNFYDYVNRIENEDELFDLIVIDGRAREECLEKAVKHLKDNGVIVFDNVERKRYRKAIAKVEDEFNITWTRGLTPALPYPTKTAVLVKLEN